MRLVDKTALVTGAARGVGRAIAIELARQGASLALLDVSGQIEGVPYELGTLSQLQYTTDECRKFGNGAFALQTDVRDLGAVQSAVQTTLSRFGRIDVLVNNAGIAAPSGKAVHEIEEEEWNLMIDIDLNGAWRLIKAVGQALIQQRSGSIINLSSTAGMVGYRYFSAYVAAKHGVVGLTRAAALDYAPHKVRVNAVLPGSVRDDTQLEGTMLREIARALDVSTADHERIFASSQPSNTLVEAQDVAHAVTWLASDESRHVTGSAIAVDGGFTAR